MRYYVSWKTIGYYWKDSLKLAARCPVSGCWPSFTNGRPKIEQSSELRARARSLAKA